MVKENLIWRRKEGEGYRSTLRPDLLGHCYPNLNVPAVKTLSLVGIEPFLNKLRQLGMKGLNESGDFYGPSLALGSADVSL
jgi:hypothetical protein